MMHEDTKQQIIDAIKPILKENGYHKHRTTWHKTTPETILVFQLAKSWWGSNQYFIHLGIYIRALGTELTPPIFHCQISPNIESLVPDKYELRQICDFEYPSFSNTERIERIADYVANVAIPWLENHSTLAKLKLLVQKEYQLLLPNVFIIRTTYDYLNDLS